MTDLERCLRATFFGVAGIAAAERREQQQEKYGSDPEPLEEDDLFPNGRWPCERCGARGDRPYVCRQDLCDDCCTEVCGCDADTPRANR